MTSDPEQLLDHVVGDADDLRRCLETALDQDQVAELLRQVDIGGFLLLGQQAAAAPVLGLRAPMNASPGFHYVHHVALQGLEAWAKSGAAPPRGTLLRGEAATGIARDGWGIALGGVRTPWVDCPTQIHSGQNDERGALEGLFGRTLPLPPGALGTLYPGGEADYLARFALSLRQTIAAGFLLEADAPEILGLAEAMFPVGHRTASATVSA